MFTGDDGSSNPGSGHGGGGDIAGALISVGAGLYDSHQNRKASKENTNKTIAAQKAESELAYQRSVEMWNMQNLYNSPEAQMARFQQAGLNPHLIYGQGNAGNASTPPQYQPANMQYRYEAPAYGAAVASALPTLMAVGTWMQNMRLSEAELEQKRTNTDRARQMVDFLTSMNPRKLEEIENKLSLYPYQMEIQKDAMAKSHIQVADVAQDFRFKYGEDLFSSLYHRDGSPTGELGGQRRLQFLQQEAKTRLEQARASWTDFGITSPQAIMQLVLQGVMGMAGQTLKARYPMSTHRSPKRVKTFYQSGKRRSQVVDY